MLYAGPLPASEVVLPVGEFQLLAEVYDEANAYGVYEVITLLKLRQNKLGRFDVASKYTLA
jgi:hypothetical protein